MLLYKAADLGMRLSAAFQSETGIPFSDVNLATHNVHQPPWTQFSSLSEVSTLAMEFTYLERAAGMRPMSRRLSTQYRLLLRNRLKVRPLARMFGKGRNSRRHRCGVTTIAGRRC